MENSSIDSAIEPVATESKIPLILAIAAFVLGGLSFVFAMNTKKTLDRHKEAIAATVQEAVDKASRAAADVQTAGGSSDEIASLKTDFEEFKTQLKAAYQEIRTSQQQIVSNAQTVNGRLARLEGRKTNTGTQQQGPDTGRPANDTGTTATAQTSGGKYKVQAGDNPSKIAKKLGIPVNDLLNANPGLDPRKLRVGQELNVPEKK